MKKYVKPEMLVLPEELNNRWNPDTCGYGLFIKNLHHYHPMRRPVPIGWTCKHPDAKISEAGRFDTGYLPYCSFAHCPMMKADMKALPEIRAILNK